MYTIYINYIDLHSHIILFRSHNRPIPVRRFFFVAQPMASKAWAAETDPSDPDTSWDGSDGSHGMGWDQATRGGHQGRLRNVTEKLRFDEISVGFPVRI